MSPADTTPRAPPRVTLRRLGSLAWPERWTLAAATVFLAVGSLSSLAFPQAVGLMMDAALGHGQGAGGSPPASVDVIAVALAGIFALQGAAMALRFWLFGRAGERVVNKLRGDLFEAIVRQETAFFDGQKTGDLASRLSSDTAVLQSAVSSNISMVLRNGAQGLGALAMLSLTSARLTLLMLAVVPPVAVAAVHYGRRVRKLAREVQDSLARAGEVAVESIGGIRTVRSFAAEAKEVTRYRGAIAQSLSLSFHRLKLSSAFMGISSFAAYGAGVLVFWYGGRLVAAGALSAGSLTKFLMYTMMLAFSVAAMAELWADFQRASGAAERVFELLCRVPEIPASGGRTLARVEGRVRFDRVSFSYPSRRDVVVLRDFELALSPGEVVALVGPSGAGKSTIASLLYRLYDPTQGRVLLDDIPLPELDPEWLRRQVGVVAQEPLLFSTSIEENIRYGRPEAQEADVLRAAAQANAHDFVARFPDGYRTLVGERGVQLSGGQKQRVAIARAILKDPRILLLDEATSALDAESEHLVKEALDRLMRGRTTLVIAHRLSTVQSADRVVVVDAGRVVQVGSHGALVAEEGLYRRLVERQFALEARAAHPSA